MLRQPIIVVLGHVDHGKTSLLDSIRQTTIAAKEAGGITQAIGTTEIPEKTLHEICGPVLERLKFEVTVPGLLFIDTPGHEAFSTLRHRGGSIADLAILVVDIVEGIMPQTEESIEILKETKTPFVVAITKIDRISGWKTYTDYFIDNYAQQSDEAKGEFEEKFYKLVDQFAKYNLPVERFDRIQDFTKQIAAVPISAKKSEGVAGLLAVLLGLAQKFLKDQLLTEENAVGSGMVLEVRELKGMGTTLDAIIYNGEIRRNDFLVISNPPMIAKVRSLLVPQPLRDIRTEKKFEPVEKATAAAGVKIAGPGLDDVMAGTEIRTVKTMEEAEKLLNEMEKEREEVEVNAGIEGLVLKADTLGSLEALKKIFYAHSIRSATVGRITKKDVIEAEANKDRFHKLVIGFNSQLPQENEQLAKDINVKIITSDVIYKLLEDYEKWLDEEKEALKKKEIDTVSRPAKIRLLPGCVFRASNPAIVGCDVEGFIKPDTQMMDEEGKNIGEVKQIQSQGSSVACAKNGDKVAISITGAIIGRQVKEGDCLYSDITSEAYKKLMKNSEFLSSSELAVLEKIFEIKKKTDKRYGI